ncbi:hypothetical protein [Sinorhizobium meliloti]|uniref:hypothetical protein n=1 Tax=Rhizobium meliloti TaxID=382 RepID=UPI003F14B990
MTSLFKMPLRAGFLLASLAASAIAGHAQAAETSYPLTLQNCGRQITCRLPVKSENAEVSARFGI